MKLQAVALAAQNLSHDLRSFVVAIPGRWLAPRPECTKHVSPDARLDEGETAPQRIRSPQQPWRLCVPPGVPDALPFAYMDCESDEA